jgi:hypothetical protein
MQEVLYLTYTGNFYFWVLLPGREIYFQGLPSPSKGGTKGNFSKIQKH